MKPPHERSQQRIGTIIVLNCGIAAPCLYFGTQVLAAAFYPGYNWLSQSASQLGSNSAPHPALFNGGAILIGVATLLAAWGFLRGLREVGAPAVLAWLTAVVLVLSAAMHFWAGVFPMPDPRHGQNPFQMAAVVAPVLIAAALWRGSSGVSRIYFVISVLGTIALLANMIPIDREVHDGLFQRLLAMAVFPPVGVGSYILLRRSSLRELAVN